MSDHPGSDPGAGQELPPAAEVVLSSVHLLVTVGFENTGLRPGSQPDLVEVELCIEGVRALLPVLERVLPGEAIGQYRQALSELQMAYAQIARASEGRPAEQEAGQEPAQEQASRQQRPPVDTPPRPKIWTPRGDV
jgi:hypothetical protein